VDPERKVLEDMAISREQPEPLFSPFFGGSIPDFKHYPLVICYIAIENGHRHSGFSH